MKCPLVKERLITREDFSQYEDQPCLREDCGMWDQSTELCSEVAGIRVLSAIGAVLGRIHMELCLSKYRYSCQKCGVRIEKKAAGEFKTPIGWTRAEQVDGKFTWLCDQCSPETE